VQGPTGKPGTPGPIGPRGFPGPPGFCENEIEMDGSGGSGEGSGELEEHLLDWKGLIPPAHKKAKTAADLKGMKCEKGQKVGFVTAI